MNNFFSRFSAYTIANILPSGISFLLLPLFTKYLTPNDYGLLSTVETVTAVFTILASLSMDRSAYRFFFDGEDEGKRQTIFANFFWGTILSFAVMTGAALLLHGQIERFSDIPFYPFYLVSFAAAAIGAIVNFLFIHLQITNQPWKYLRLGIIKSLFVAASTTLMVVFARRGPAGQVWGNFTGLAMLLPFVALYAHSHFKGRLNFDLLARGLKYSLPFVPTLLIAWIINMSDRLFLDRYSTKEMLGIYAMGYKIASIFLIVTSGFAMAFQPEFLKLAAEGGNIPVLAKRIEKLSLLYVTIAFFLAFVVPEIFGFVIDARYAEGADIARIILMSHLLSGIMGLSSNLYFVHAKKSMLQMYVFMGGAALNTALNFWLIPLYGMHGAAASTVATMAVFTIVHYNVCRKFYFIPVGWPKIIGLGLGFMILDYGVATLRPFLSLPSMAALKLLIMLGIAVFVALRVLGLGDVLKNFAVRIAGSGEA